MIVHAKTVQASDPPNTDGLIDSGEIIDRFLVEQKRVKTAVSCFSQWHDQVGHDPLLRKAYQDLIPLNQPSPDEQYAFQVDLDVCTGCKACVVACHSLNGLDDGETWRDIGSLHLESESHALQQTVTSACHHCADPACSNGCPVLAYEKDEKTGIVRHLDDQCIGCQYCILKCPYDVPKYNDRLGIVRKCDMCHSRLSSGEAPACVQSCPNQAIRIIKVTPSEMHFQPGETLVPGVFASDYTRPTTQYLTKNPAASRLKPADASLLRVEHTHGPLVTMLVLTQASAGTILAQSIELLLGKGLHLPLMAFALLAAMLGLAASVLHLGRPLQAWRAFLGWRKSWLSREILVFGLWFPFVAGLFVLALDPFKILLRIFQKDFTSLPAFDLLIPAMALAASLLGLAALACSMMVYIDTRRPFWSLKRTSLKFIGTAAILGSAVTAFSTGSVWWILCSGCFVLLKVTAECRFLEHSNDEDSNEPETKSARVLWNVLGVWTRARTGASLLGAALLFVVPWAGCLFLLLGEFGERVLFFRAVTAPRMPGNLH